MMKAEVVKSRDNPSVRHFARLSKERAYREECREYVLEGAKLLSEALSSGIRPKTVFFLEKCRRDFDFGVLEGCEGIRLYSTDERVIDKISDVKSPQGIVFSCPLPDTALPERLPQGFYLILDGLSDPGNLGTIVRTADAFALDGIMLTGACADPFSPKTVRSAMGSLFRVRLCRGEPNQIKAALDASDIPIFSALPSDEAGRITEIFASCAAVAIGSEAHGVSEQVRALSRGAVTIPMKGRAESLNAAVSAAIVMWEMTKRG